MYRNIINDFVVWFEEPKRKILHLKGAYGVGKTWAVKDFATAFFSNRIYVDLDEKNEYLDIIFSQDAEYEEKINMTDKLIENDFGAFDCTDTLLIFDNLPNCRECDEFFYNYAKKHRHYVICLISNSMQITEFEYGHPDVFRVLRLRPLSFEEYLIANKALPLISAVQNNKAKELNPFEIASITRFLTEYMQTGGMPAIVNNFIKNKDYNKVREMQLDLIKEYEQKIKSHMSSSLATRCKRIWKSIPKQLCQDNKKFMYKYVEENARSREYAEATQTLCDLGFIRKMPKLTKGEMPLEDYVDYKSFQLFLIDHGLLRAIYGNPVGEDVKLESMLNENNFAVAEQYIFQELSNKVGPIYYWNSGATARVPFIYEGDGSPIPVDIRFKNNNKAQNIKTFIAKNPEVNLSVKISYEQVSLNNNVLNIPIYGLWNL